MALARIARQALRPSASSQVFWRSFAAPSSPAGGVAAAAAEPAAAPAEPPTVAKRIVDVTAIDAEGVRHNVKGLTGKTLLQALITNKLETPERHPLEELGSCTGNCEVTIANEWLSKLPPRSADEEAKLLQVSTTGKVDKNSRLGCQIVLDKSLDGITVAMTEERPWYTL